MNPVQQKPILAIALHAAFADGAKHEREREEIGASPIPSSPQPARPIWPGCTRTCCPGG